MNRNLVLKHPDNAESLLPEMCARLSLPSDC